MASKLQIQNTSVENMDGHCVSETPNPPSHTHKVRCTKRHEHSHEVTYEGPHTSTCQKALDREQAPDPSLSTVVLGVAPLILGASAVGGSIATTLLTGETGLIGATCVGQAAAGAGAVAFGAGYLVGEGIQKAFPALPAALENLADNLINGKPTFTEQPTVKAEAPISTARTETLSTKQTPIKPIDAGMGVTAIGGTAAIISSLAPSMTGACGSAPLMAIAGGSVTAGVAVACAGAGFVLGEVLKAEIPSLQPAADVLADRLINGKSTFTSDAALVASSSESPKFAPKVTNSPENAPVVGVGESAPISLSLPQKATQHANTAPTRDIE